MKKEAKRAIFILLGIVCVVVAVWGATKLYLPDQAKKVLEEELRQAAVDAAILREVDSYEALRETFTAQPEVFFPEEPDESVTEMKLYVLLAGTGDEAEPSGYSAGYSVTEGRTEIHYFRSCSMEKTEIDTDTHYCGILYRLDASEGHGELYFSFRDYGYCLRYTMETKGLNDEEIGALEEKAKEELLQTMHEIIDQYTEALKEKYRTEEDSNTSLEGKTVLTVLATREDFLVVNAEGQSFTFDGGYAVGTMPVYGMDFIVDGWGPSPLRFLVDSSVSFTCIATGEKSRIMRFSATGEKASGFVSADEGEAGWKNVTIDDAGGIYTEAIENE